jgi:MFS family permease
LFALGAPVALLVVTEILAGIAFALFLVWWETALAHHIPPAALSRVSAYDLSGSLALLPLAYLLAGPVAAAFGARTVLGVGSLIGLILLGVCLLPRETRELGSPPASAEQVARQVVVEVGREP